MKKILNDLSDKNQPVPPSETDIDTGREEDYDDLDEDEYDYPDDDGRFDAWA